MPAGKLIKVYSGKRSRRRRKRQSNRYGTGFKNKGTLRTQTVLKYRGIGFPDRFMTKLQYVDSGSTDKFGSTAGSVEYRLNGPFDPEVAVGGDQPVYFDTFSSIYEKYRVLGCAYEIVLMNNNTTASQVGVLPVVNASPAIAVDDIGAQRGGQVAFLMSNAGGNNVKTLKGYVSMASLFGKEGIKYDDIDAATDSNTPGQGGILHISAESVDGTNTLNLFYRVKLTYYVEWYKLQERTHDT